MSCEEEDDVMEKLEYNLLVIYVRLNYEIINVCVCKCAYECIKLDIFWCCLSLIQ